MKKLPTSGVTGNVSVVSVLLWMPGILAGQISVLWDVLKIPACLIHFRPIVWLTIVCILSGCHSGDPLDKKITAESSDDFAHSRRGVIDVLDREQMLDFDDAVQEIRLRIIIGRNATGKSLDQNLVDGGVRERINELSVREIIQIGYRSKLERLNMERLELETMIHENAVRRTRHGDTEAARFLHDLGKDQSEQLQAVLQKISKTEDRLKLYDPRSPEKKSKSALETHS